MTLDGLVEAIMVLPPVVQGNSISLHNHSVVVDMSCPQTVHTQRVKMALSFSVRQEKFQFPVPACCQTDTFLALSKQYGQL